MRYYLIEAVTITRPIKRMTMHIDLDKVAAIKEVESTKGSTHGEGSYQIPIILDSGNTIYFQGLDWRSSVDNQVKDAHAGMRDVLERLVNMWKLG